MSFELVGLALLMGLATYPWRAVPLLVPGIERLPAPAREYLTLIGPAMLAALAVVSVAVVVDENRTTSLHVGVEWIAVAICGGVVLSGRSLLLGLVLAAGFLAVLRFFGVAPLP